jgi:hypothetical protein
MKCFLAAMLISWMMFATSTYASPIEATTSEGRKILLYDDGTWKFKDKAGFTKSVGAIKTLKSKKGFVELWYVPSKWSISKNKLNEAAEFNLIHTSGDGYAVVIIERIGTTMPSLVAVAMEKARSVAADAELVLDEERTVNNVQVKAMQIEGTTAGIPFKYYGYFWTGDAGTVQVITYTGQKLFNEFEDDFVELLNGLVITKR